MSSKILETSYINNVANELRKYPPSVVAEFVVRLVDQVGLKQWDDGRLYRNLIQHSYSQMEQSEESDVIQQIKTKLPLVKFVACYTDGLRSSGSKFFVGKCPFCEKKNKFWVSQNGVCNCFHCRFEKPMDIVNFCCRYHQIEIDEAIHQLAKEAGLNL